MRLTINALAKFLGHKSVPQLGFPCSKINLALLFNYHKNIILNIIILKKDKPALTVDIKNINYCKVSNITSNIRKIAFNPGKKLSLLFFFN